MNNPCNKFPASVYGVLDKIRRELSRDMGENICLYDVPQINIRCLNRRYNFFNCVSMLMSIVCPNMNGKQN